MQENSLLVAAWVVAAILLITQGITLVLYLFQRRKCASLCNLLYLLGEKDSDQVEKVLQDMDTGVQESVFNIRDRPQLEGVMPLFRPAHSPLASGHSDRKVSLKEPDSLSFSKRFSQENHDFCSTKSLEVVVPPRLETGQVRRVAVLSICLRATPSSCVPNTVVEEMLDKLFSLRVYLTTVSSTSIICYFNVIENQGEYRLLACEAALECIDIARKHDATESVLSVDAVVTSGRAQIFYWLDQDERRRPYVYGELIERAAAFHVLNSYHGTSLLVDAYVRSQTMYALETVPVDSVTYASQFSSNGEANSIEVYEVLGLLENQDLGETEWMYSPSILNFMGGSNPGLTSIRTRCHSQEWSECFSLFRACNYIEAMVCIEKLYEVTEPGRKFHRAITTLNKLQSRLLGGTLNPAGDHDCPDEFLTELLGKPPQSTSERNRAWRHLLLNPQHSILVDDILVKEDVRDDCVVEAFHGTHQ